jgi:hypothetical protein
MIVNARFGNTCKSKVLLPLQETLHPQDWYEKEMKLKDIGIKLTFLTKCFQYWKKFDNLYRCKTPNPQ